MESLRKIQGAYCLTVMTEDKLIGARDPQGFRPLCLGRLEDGGYVLSSESCGLDVVGAEFVRDIQPGEMVVIDDTGVQSYRFDEDLNIAQINQICWMGVFLQKYKQYLPTKIDKNESYIWVDAYVKHWQHDLNESYRDTLIENDCRKSD